MIKTRAIALLLPLVAILLVGVFSAVPTETAHACLPCTCPEFTTVNCFGPYALYTPTFEDGRCALDIFYIDIQSGRGFRAIRLFSNQLAVVPDFPETNLLLAVSRNRLINLYKLSSGEYQINVGPDAEGKVYVTRFRGCPARDVVESNFFAREGG